MVGFEAGFWAGKGNFRNCSEKLFRCVTRRVLGVAKNLLYQALASIPRLLVTQIVLLTRGFLMTQMMLFDAPIEIAPTAVYSTTEAIGAESGNSKIGRRSSSSHFNSNSSLTSERLCAKRSGHFQSAGFVEGSSCTEKSEVLGSRGQRISVSDEDGVQRMGDLARLVLLRYDLMAKRRAQYAARRCAR